MKNETIELKLTKNEFEYLAELFFERYYHSLNKPNFYNQELNNVYDKFMKIKGLNPLNGEKIDCVNKEMCHE